MARIFIDGAYGTVGMALRARLKELETAGIEIIEISEADRRNHTLRGDAYAAADLVVLCLPDEDAKDAAIHVDRANHRARILDASAAHRCDPQWIYGLPQISWEHRKEIANAHWVANPGCFATACILAARPLPLESMDFHGITGASAGGKNARATPRLAQFGQRHRHLAEIARYGVPYPTLTTAVGSWYQGMLVQATVAMSADTVAALYKKAYDDDSSIKVVFMDEDIERHIGIESCNGTNKTVIYVSSLPDTRRTAIAVVLDNLGKGSAGAACANIQAMLDL